MRKTRLVILPGVRSLKTIGCLLLFLACPTIAFKGQENREVEPLCNAQNFKEFWIQESPWPEGPDGTGKRTDDLGSGLRHDMTPTINTRSTESLNRRLIGDQRADSRRASPAYGIPRNLLVERRGVRRQSTSESRHRVVDVRGNLDARRERTQVADKIRSSDEMRRTYENRISRNSIDTRNANTREFDLNSERSDESRRRTDSNRLSLVDRRSNSRDVTPSARDTRFLNTRDARENRRNAVDNRALSTDRSDRIEETRSRTRSSMASSLPERITRSKRQAAREDNRMNRFETGAESVTYISRVVVREPTTTDSRRHNIVERENTRMGRRDQVRRVDRNGRIEDERRNVDIRRNNMRHTEQVRVNIYDTRRDASLDRRARSHDVLNSNMNSDERNVRTISGERGITAARNIVNSGSNLNRRHSRLERTVEREVRLADQSRFDTRRSLFDDGFQRLSINQDSRTSIDKPIRSSGIRMQTALNDREGRLADFNRREEGIRNLKRTAPRREVRSDDDRSASIRTTRDGSADIQRNPVRNLVRKVRSTNEREIRQLENRQNINSPEDRRFEIRANKRQSTSTERYRRSDKTQSAAMNRQSDRTSQLHERQLTIRNERNIRDARVIERRLSETDHKPMTGADIRRALSDNRIPTFVQSHTTGIRSVEDRRRSDSVPELHSRTSERSDGISFRNVRRLDRSSSKSNVQLRDQIRANPYQSYSTERKFRVQPSVRSLVRDIQSDGTIQIIDRRLNERDLNNVRETRTSERRATVTLKRTEESRGDMRRVQVGVRDFRLQSSKQQLARDIRSDKTRQLLDRTLPETTHKLTDDMVADSKRVRNDIRSTRYPTPDQSRIRDIRIAEANRQSRRLSRFDNRIDWLNENIIRETRIMGRDVLEANLAGPRNVRADIGDSRHPTRIQSFTRDTRSLGVRRRSDRTSQIDDRRNRNILRETRLLDRTALDRERNRLEETRAEQRRVSLSPTSIRSQERDIRAVEASRRQDRTFRNLERQSREGREEVRNVRTDTRDSQNPMTVRAPAGRSVEVRRLSARASQFVGSQSDRRDGNTFRETRSLIRTASGTELKPKDEIRVDFRRVLSDNQDSRKLRSVRSRTNIRSVEDSIQLDRISRRVGRELERGTGNIIRDNRILDRTVSETRLKPNNVVRLRTNIRDSQNPTSSRTLTRSIRSVEAGRRLDRTSRLMETQLDTRNGNVFRETTVLGITDSAAQLKPRNEIRADQRIRTGREFRTTSIRSNGRYIRSAEASRRLDGVSRLINGKFEGRKDNAFGEKIESGTYNLPVGEAMIETRISPINIRDSRFSTFSRSFARDALPVEIKRRSIRRNSVPPQVHRHLERTSKSDRMPTDETRTETKSRSVSANRQSDRSSRLTEIDGNVRRLSNRQDDKSRRASFISAGVFGREMNFVRRQTNNRRVNDGSRYQDRTEILFAKRVSDGRMERIGATSLDDRTSRLVNRQADTETRKDSRLIRLREINHSDVKMNKRSFRVGTVERYTDYRKTHNSYEEFGLPQKASYFETTKMAVMNLISTLDFTNTDYKGVGATVLYGGIMCYSLFTNVNKKVIF